MKTLLGVGALLAMMAAGAWSSDAWTGDDPQPRRPHHHQQQQSEFVQTKKEWTRCVADAARDHSRGSGRFDPEAACGTKPRPPGKR